ncbi:MAG: MarR family transcriptional regulator [Acidimicrobiia bacterium]|nr:MarR family transcriptional regulator [Acidimicrobiia bacterium]
MPSSPDYQSIADRLHSAAIHLLRRLRRQDAAMDLSPARASALSVLVFGGPVTIGQLAAAEQVSTPTITRLVVGMERDGLLKRRGDERDGRVVWLEATARGAKILKEGRRRRVAALAAELKTLPPEELDLLSRAADLLQRLTRPGGP